MKNRNKRQSGLKPLPGNESASDKETLKIAAEELALERQQVETSLLVEDFKARWQELLSLQNENNRWTSLYVTALLLVIGWVINNNWQHDGGFADLYARSNNSYLILTIAVVNALYAFSMAYKGYQIQQIALYQHEVLGRRIRDFAREFDQWERYRRRIFVTWHGQDPIRLAYFALVKSLPLVVSYLIIVMYWSNQWTTEAQIHHWKSWRNWYSILTFLLVDCALLFSVQTLKAARRWIRILEEERCA
jgi:hypothetical protein